MAATIPLHKAFCMNARIRRQQLDLTQLEVAEKLGMTQSAYAQIEMGRRVPSLEVVDRVAAALSIPAPMLFISSELVEA